MKLQITVITTDKTDLTEFNTVSPTLCGISIAGKNDCSRVTPKFRVEVDKVISE